MKYEIKQTETKKTMCKKEKLKKEIKKLEKKINPFKIGSVDFILESLKKELNELNS